MTLIIPGRETWELWYVKSTGECELKLTTEETNVHLIKEMPGGETVLFFPLNQLTFAPFSVETTDESLFDDLVDSHWEQMGIRLSPEDGILSDYAVLEKGSAATLLAPFSLSPQREEDLPARLPSHFDISPHVYNVKGDTLVFHKQLGKWGMSFYRDGRIFFASILGINLDEEAIRGAKMTLLQLTLQGCCPSSYRVELWNDREIPFIAPMLNLPVHTVNPPSPALPRIWSKILPADVHAERRKKASQERLRTVIIVSVLAYIGVIIYLYSGIYFLSRDVAELKKINDINSAPYAELQSVKSKWDALAPMIDADMWSDDIMNSASNARPDNTVNFTYFELKKDENTAYPKSIIIRGTASNPDSISKFSSRLRSPQYKLNGYEWSFPNPEPPTREGALWTFNYQAEMPVINEEQP